jgi:hypothetical protein
MDKTEDKKLCESHCSDCPFEDWYACHGMTQTPEPPMDNKEKPLTDFLKFHSGYYGESVDNIKQIKYIAFTGDELFEYVTTHASQQNEALQAKTEADKIYIDTLHGQIGDLKSEKEALQAENLTLSKMITSQDLRWRDKIKSLESKNTQLVEALRGVKKEVEARQNQAHCYRILLLIDKALSQNNQPEK